MQWLGSFFSGILSYLGLYKKSGSIIFLGLDNAGKTTLLRRLKDDRMVENNPTVHAHVEQLSLGKINIRAIDIGGHKNVRKTWRNYFPNLDAIVYMIDAANPKRFKESKEELNYILQTPEIKGIPIAILGNKIDKKDAVQEDVLRLEFGLANKTTWGVEKLDQIDGRPINVFMCSVAKKAGYAEAFKWVGQFLK